MTENGIKFVYQYFCSKTLVQMLDIEVDWNERVSCSVRLENQADSERVFTALRLVCSRALMLIMAFCRWFDKTNYSLLENDNSPASKN